MGQIKIQDDRLCHIKLNRNLIEMSTDFDGILYTVDLKGRYVAKEIKNLKMADSCHIENDFFWPQLCSQLCCGLFDFLQILYGNTEMDLADLVTASLHFNFQNSKMAAF